jgi:hypothetical protein
MSTTVITGPAASAGRATGAPAAAAGERESLQTGLWGLPWTVVLAATAITSTLVGVQWDIAWHRSVGRDTFWSPPHMAIYLGAILAGLSAAHAILTTTFGRDAAAAAARGAAVRIWGFRGPLGAFVSAWGGMAMLASAPFDDWWHNAYGLDVKILSPPHTVLALGIFALCSGALLTVIGHLNRARHAERRALQVAFVFTAGMVLVLVMTFVMQLTHLVHQHGPRFYRVVGLMAPAVLIGLGRAPLGVGGRLRFGATAVAGVYTAAMLAFLWIFPLVPAVPRLGPVFNPVTHLIPQGFPLLLIVPSLLIDLCAPRLEARLGGRSAWWLALALTGLWMVSFVVVQWLFASFLLSPAGHNAIFGSHYAGYGARADWAERRGAFIELEPRTDRFAQMMALAALATLLSTRLGLFASSALGRLRR